MIKHPTGFAVGIAAAAALGIIASAHAAPQAHSPAPVTKSLKQHPPAEDARIHAFYDILVAARADGADKVDAATEKKLREMARASTPAHDLDAKAWEDHVVDMGRQMFEIARKDPKVFQSYENFLIALRGPQ